jgi:chromosome segregation ATPase
MVQKQTSQASIWAKGQSKVIATMKEKYDEEKQAHLKSIDSLRRANSRIESESAHLKRDLESCQLRSFSLEKQFGSIDNDHRNSTNKLLLKVAELETQLEAFDSKERETVSHVSALEEQIASLHLKSKEKETSHCNVVEGLQNRLLSMQGTNQALSSRVSHLEDESEKAREIHAKEKQAIQQATEQRVREMHVEIEALRVANKNEMIKVKQKHDLLERQSSLHASAFDQFIAEKKDAYENMEQEIAEAREVGSSLMSKVEELHGKIHVLTAEKHQLLTRIETLEGIIANGEVRLAQFGKQLTLSMQDQQRRILNEAELKKELSRARLELEKLKKEGRIIGHDPIVQSWA